jgi:hypothetical protein
MPNLFILIYSGAGGVKFMKHFKRGASYKVWEPLHYELDPNELTWARNKVPSCG